MLLSPGLCASSTPLVQHTRKCMSEFDGTMINGLVTSQTHASNSLLLVTPIRFPKTGNET